MFGQKKQESFNVEVPPVDGELSQELVEVFGKKPLRHATRKLLNKNIV